ncbi:MAG: toxin-antitoxin system YwqK family antitoxin [Candidatus Syntrophosphaera sp.]
MKPIQYVFRFRATARGKFSAVILLICLFSMAIGLLTAQSNNDEYRLMQDFSLHKSAIPFSELSLEDELFLKDGQPFTGMSYELFEEGKLSRVASFLKGKQDGPMYLWYPDGSPQMSANYRQGRLNGRFFGWYRNGNVIYDLVINEGGFAGDYVSDDDSRRLETELEAEGEGDAGESSQGE